ncbi:MAG: hypothetical protein OJF61_001988 [Rhodanobacteraceae bacterium]|jgi:hypothetical protein|nr:MAG: hypothetical protein OJF61_001988 [Rhodanobacteraceae bacterium]
MRSHRYVCVFAGALLAASAAFAGEPVNGPFDISTPQTFEQQAAQVSAGMQAGGAYGFLSAQERARVEQEIMAMRTLFQRYGNIETMDGARRVELYNAQESVNQILTRGQAGSTRCAWAQPTGSHIPRTSCWSIGT